MPPGFEVAGWQEESGGTKVLLVPKAANAEVKLGIGWGKGRREGRLLPVESDKVFNDPFQWLVCICVWHYAPWGLMCGVDDGAGRFYKHSYTYLRARRAAIPCLAGPDFRVHIHICICNSSSRMLLVSTASIIASCVYA